MRVPGVWRVDGMCGCVSVGWLLAACRGSQDDLAGCSAQDDFDGCWRVLCCICCVKVHLTPCSCCALCAVLLPQLFWEAFPAEGGASRTTYMFAYTGVTVSVGVCVCGCGCVGRAAVCFFGVVLLNMLSALQHMHWRRC